MASILVTEDSIHLCSRYRAELIDAGYEVFTALDGLHGYAAFMERKPDLLVTNYDLPLMNGLDLIRMVREAGAPTPVILLTDSGDPDVSQAAREDGLSGITVLPKPVEVSELLSQVSALLLRY